MKYKKLYRLAKKIDKLKTNKNLNRNRILKLLERFNPEYIGHGAYKRSFKVKSNKKFLVFKVGRSLQEDYNHFVISKGKHKMKYAKIYWVTDNCLLQKFCLTNEPYPKREYEELKKEWKKAGYRDVRPANIGKIKGKLYAFDVSASRKKNK